MLEVSTAITLILTYRYYILFPLACFEGPILALVIGFLVHLGYFNAVPAFLLLCAGDFFPDILYYYIGHFGHKKNFLEKYGSRFKIIANNFHIIEKLWRDHSYKTMFLSKLAYGLSTPLLISAGLSKIPVGKFIWRAFIVTVFQYGIIMTLGYYLGYSYAYAEKYLVWTSIILAFVLVAFIFTYHRIQTIAKRKIEELEKLEQQTI